MKKKEPVGSADSAGHVAGLPERASGRSWTVVERRPDRGIRVRVPVALNQRDGDRSQWGPQGRCPVVLA
nr:hypothetical 7.5k protein - rabbit [Oryctolagus cuniculus]